MKENRKKGAVLIEVLVALFITAVVFVAVYATISVSLVNTRYLQQVRETSGFASQLSEAFSSCANSEKTTMFDYIKGNYTDVADMTEIDLEAVDSYMAELQANGVPTAHYLELIDEENRKDYTIQLFLISPNSVYLSEQSLGTPFGSGICTPNDKLMTIELRVQRNSKDWGNRYFSIYKQRQPAVISYVFQVNRG